MLFLALFLFVFSVQHAELWCILEVRALELFHYYYECSRLLHPLFAVVEFCSQWSVGRPHNLSCRLLKRTSWCTCSMVWFTWPHGQVAEGTSFHVRCIVQSVNCCSVCFIKGEKPSSWCKQRSSCVYQTTPWNGVWIVSLKTDFWEREREKRKKVECAGKADMN